MTMDESFKKPGSVPFNWEIKPGVPKQPQLPSPPRKLRPPPSVESEPERSSASFSSAPKGRSARWRLGRAEAPVVVSSLGCFAASPLLNRKPSGKKSHGPCVSGLETPRRRSVSSRSSAVSPFRESPGMPFYSSSGRSSPSFKAGNDAEWAGFGLF